MYISCLGFKEHTEVLTVLNQKKTCSPKLVPERSHLAVFSRMLIAFYINKGYTLNRGLVLKRKIHIGIWISPRDTDINIGIDVDIDIPHPDR